MRLFSQFPANFCLKKVKRVHFSDKTKRPAGRFLINLYATYWKSSFRCKCLFYARLPAPRHGGDATTVSCNPSHSLRV
ncbi:hypothetical protein F0Q32_04415 [Pseudocitrobacter sp. 73]|nr:hypothetical protein F0Q32_04415 [Pseudocitrobacter sp. 73]